MPRPSSKRLTYEYKHLPHLERVSWDGRTLVLTCRPAMDPSFAQDFALALCESLTKGMIPYGRHRHRPTDMTQHDQKITIAPLNAMEALLILKRVVPIYETMQGIPREDQSIQRQVTRIQALARPSRAERGPFLLHDATAAETALGLRALNSHILAYYTRQTAPGAKHKGTPGN